MKNDEIAKLEKDTEVILHDMRNPAAFISNNLSALSKYLINIKRLWEHNQEILEFIDQENGSLPPRVEKSLYQLKSICTECDFAFMLKDIEELAAESSDGCRQMAAKIEELQNLFNRKENVQG